MPQTYKQQFNKKHKQPLNKSNSLKEISDLSGYKLSGIKTIFEKGKGAYKSNPQSVRPHVKSASQWGYARVYASVNPKSWWSNQQKQKPKKDILLSLDYIKVVRLLRLHTSGNVILRRGHI
jgi:hypothetical protein